MTPTEIHQRLLEVFGPDDILGLEAELIDPVIVVRPGALRAVATHLRDAPELAMDFLRLLTGLDRPDAFEVVYHLFSYPKRHSVGLRARLDREAPTVDSVWDIWRTAEWHERETWDLVGITFTGHPDLRRLMMPDDWVGHPLRKDYQKPSVYHSIPTTRPKPSSQAPTHVFPPAEHVAKAEVEGEWMQVNMGPHHPATHGVINFLLETDGEIIRRARPDVGYLHRGLEKLAEITPYGNTMPYTDRVDYLGSMFTNHGWAMAVEKLVNVQVPPRAEYCRVIASELNRIASHQIATGALAMDIGAYTPFIHWLRERETINDIMEIVCGARLTYNYMRVGGVARDIKQPTLDRILTWLDHFEPMIDEFDRLISNNEIFIKRLANVSTISAEEAVSFGLVGPNLRASGVDWDIRRDEPYSVYGDLEFKVIVGQGLRGSVGDAYDRFVCRVLEIRESVKILRQACLNIPEGEVQGKVPRDLKPTANEVYARVEGARGENGFYIVADGQKQPYRVRYRTGSFTGMSIIEHLSPGLMVADLVALIGSLDVVAPEVDR